MDYVSDHITAPALLKLIYLYISYIFKKSNCNYLRISKAELKTTPLSFISVYESEKCVGELQAASMQNYKHNGNEGILISTSVHTSCLLYTSPSPRDS